MTSDRRRMSARARLARGTLAALVAVGSAALAHTAAGHHAPHLVVVVLALAVSIPVCVQLSGTALSRGRLAAAVLSSQVILHGLFALFPASTVVPSGLPTGGHAHHHGSLTRESFSDGVGTAHADGLSQHGDHSVYSLASPTDSAMVLAHLFAALAAFGLLRFGETLAYAIVELLRIVPAMRLLDLGPIEHTPSPRAIPSARGTENVPPTWLGSGPRSLRGPPVLVKQTLSTFSPLHEKGCSFSCTQHTTPLPHCVSESRH